MKNTKKMTSQKGSNGTGEGFPMREFGVDERTKAIMKTEEGLQETDEDGFIMPRKSKIKKKKNVDTKATESAMEILTNTSPTKAASKSPIIAVSSVAIRTRPVSSEDMHENGSISPHLTADLDLNRVEESVTFTKASGEKSRLVSTNSGSSNSIPSLEGNSSLESAVESKVDNTRNTAMTNAEETLISFHANGGGDFIVEDNFYTAPVSVTQVEQTPLVKESKTSTKSATSASSSKKKKTPVEYLALPAATSSSSQRTKVEPIKARPNPSSTVETNTAPLTSGTANTAMTSAATKRSPQMTTSSAMKSPLISSASAAKSPLMSSATTRAQSNSLSSADQEEEARRLAREWAFKHSLPEDLSRLVLVVGDFKTFGASPAILHQMASSDGHVRFRITRSLLDETVSPQSVFRRFRDFQALYLRLANLFPLEVVPSLPTTFTLFRTNSDEFLQFRARRLEAFLHTLLRRKPSFWASPDLHAFMLKESEEFDEMAVKYLSNNGKDLDVPPPAMTEKLSDSLSFLVRYATAQVGTAASSSTATPPEESKFAEEKGEVSAAYEALSCYIDKQGAKQERLTAWETGVDTLEQIHLTVSSKHELLGKLRVAFRDDLDVDDLYASAFDPSDEEVFARQLVGSGRERPLAEFHHQGCLRTAHQAATLLGGARELHSRIVMPAASGARTDLLATSKTAVKDVTKSFAKLKRETSAFALDLAQEFAEVSLEKAQSERARLEELKKMLLEMQ